MSSCFSLTNMKLGLLSPPSDCRLVSIAAKESPWRRYWVSSSPLLSLRGLEKLPRGFNCFWILSRTFWVILSLSFSTIWSRNFSEISEFATVSFYPVLPRPCNSSPWFSWICSWAFFVSNWLVISASSSFEESSGSSFFSDFSIPSDFCSACCPFNSILSSTSSF